MKEPYLDLTPTADGWQGTFALQVFHRRPEDWIKMRWGFNPGVLLEEALDRQKLFIESQGAADAEFRSGILPSRTVALRGINQPGTGLQIGLLGKAGAQNESEAQRAALNYARELCSIFPQDFIVIPAATSDDYQRLSGHELISAQSKVVQIQRGNASASVLHEYHFLFGLWQASSRSNEQIWRALSNMPQGVIFNVLLQPTFFYEGEKKALLEMKKQILNSAQGNDLTPAYTQWIENLIKRRLATWRKFFILQVHVIAEGELDENLLRSIGSALTRDTNDLPLPGYQIKQPDSEEDGQSWRQNILSLDFIPASRMEDLVDSDEAHAVFRVPYLPEAGVPGANFIAYQAGSLPLQNEPEQ